MKGLSHDLFHLTYMELFSSTSRDSHTFILFFSLFLSLSNIQAPSASLCIAIFKLHSDSIACGQQLIDYCCKLSRNLANPEVDAGLLIDIMKQLLFSAKMMFVKAGRSQELALCDR